MTRKHQSTDRWLKPMVRVFKNIRQQGWSTMASSSRGGTRQLPITSEGLLYSVPDEKFGRSYSDCFCEAINWIQQADKTQFLCANEQYYLLRNWSHVCWEPAKCDKFLAAAIELWDGW